MIKYFTKPLICLLCGIATITGTTDKLTKEESVQIWYETEYYPVDLNQADWSYFLDYDNRIIVNPPLALLKSFSDEKIVTLMTEFPLMSSTLNDYESEPDSVSCMFYMYERDVDIYRELLRRNNCIYSFLEAYRDSKISENDFTDVSSKSAFPHKVAMEAFMCQFVNFYYLNYFDDNEKNLADTIIKEKTPIYETIKDSYVRKYFKFDKIEYESAFYEDFQYDEEIETERKSEKECIDIWYETEYYPINANPPDWDAYTLDEYFTLLNPPEDLLESFSDEKLATLVVTYPMIWQITSYDIDQLDSFFDMYERKVNVYSRLLKKKKGISILLEKYRDSGFSPKSYVEYDNPILEFDQKIEFEAFMCQFINYYYNYFDKEEKKLADKIIEEKEPIYKDINDDLTKMYFEFKKIDYESTLLNDQNKAINPDITIIYIVIGTVVCAAIITLLISKKKRGS